MPVLPESDNPADIRRFLRSLKVDFTLLHPETVMLKRYYMVVPLLQIAPGGELDEISQRAFRHLYETVDIG